MSDIVRRLRVETDRICSEAADEIERLRAERDYYKGTLRHLAGEGVTAARNALADKEAKG